MSQSSDVTAVFRAPWRQVMTARARDEEHRASTPLELLFDLCFVVAIAQAAAGLAHGVEADHVGVAVLGYLVVFFAIWWAWMNFTWFASAYDTDDVPYRLLTVAQMAGVLVLAAGVPAALADYDYRTVTVGYAIMRVPMVVQWLRAAVEDPAGRGAAVRYAGGIALVQVLWLARLALPQPWGWVGFGVLVVAELAVPAYAEGWGSRPTSWHPEHIAERYGLFTLLALGEVVLGTTVAVQTAGTEAGLSAQLLLLAGGGLLLIVGLWWTYFLGGDWGSLRESPMRVALTWGYGHYLVFASVGALGAALDVAVQAVQDHVEAPPLTVGLVVAVPVAVFVVVLAQLRRLTWSRGAVDHVLTGAMAVLVLACGFLAPLVGLGTAVCAMGVAVAATLAAFLARRHRTEGRRRRVQGGGASG